MQLLKFSSPKLLNRILRCCTQIVLCVIKVCSNGGASYIKSKLIVKANLNIAIVMQIFENLILQNCSTKFYDIAHTWSLVYV